MRNRADRADVLGDIVARGSIAARGGIAQGSVLVQERNGNAVHLWFHDGLDERTRKQLFEPGKKRADLAFGIRVVQAEHRRAMPDLRELLQRRPAYVPGRGIGRGEIGKRRLEIEQLPVEPVVFPVGDDRCGVLIVELVVLLNFPPQRRNARCGFER